MPKIPKTYRLSPMTIRQLQRLKELEPGSTDTELIETAITYLLAQYTSPPAPSLASVPGRWPSS